MSALAAQAPSQYLRRERNNFQKPLSAQFPGHGSKDTGADRFVLIVEQYGRVVIETDITAVLPAHFLAGAYDHGMRDIALFDFGVGYCLFYGDDDNVADCGITAPRAPEHLDTHYFARAGIIRHPKY